MMENLILLINNLIEYPDETPWLEFKHDNYDPKMIGKDISALANGATLSDKDNAYFIWGVNNETHEIVGTKYNLQTLKKGNQEIESWLRNLLSAHTDFEYQMVELDGVMVGVMIIKAAFGYPVAFEKEEYIRVGSYTKPLRDYPALQSKLWRKLQNQKFEEQPAKKNLSQEKLLELLDIRAYFERLSIPMPSTPEEIIHIIEEEGVVSRQDDGLYSISNLGAILFARRTESFPSISRKAVRIVQYEGRNRVSILKEEQSKSGYAVEFEDLMRYIKGILPSREVFDNGVRKAEEKFPGIAIRELMANALIHQDFSVTGAGPLIEIFENRVEVTNPGTPLVDVFRIIDTPPKSRNERLSALMRRMGLCEELGSGWDRIAIVCEEGKLPAPKMEVYEESSKATLFARVDFSQLTIEERLWACYLHACICYLQDDFLTNSSFRERFGLKESSSGMVSRIIKEAVDKKVVRPFDPDTAPRYMKYVPIWA